MINLTEQQFKIFDVIKGHVNDYGYPPTRAEIAKIMGFKSVNAAESHIKALVKKGVLLKVPDSSRGLKLVEEYSGIPIVGRVAAGSPISAVENIEKYQKLEQKSEKQTQNQQLPKLRKKVHKNCM